MLIRKLVIVFMTLAILAPLAEARTHKHKFVRNSKHVSKRAHRKAGPKAKYGVQKHH